MNNFKRMCYQWIDSQILNLLTIVKIVYILVFFFIESNLNELHFFLETGNRFVIISFLYVGKNFGVFSKIFFFEDHFPLENIRSHVILVKKNN